MISKLFRGGTPAIFAQGISLFVPLLGILYLSDSDYVTWVLLSALSSIFISVDFGASALAIKYSASGQFTARVHSYAIVATVGPVVIVSLAISGIWPYYAGLAGVHIGAVEFSGYLILVTVGASARSVAMVYASVMLGRAEFRSRGLALFFGALLNIAAVFILLECGAGNWSLGAGLLASGFAQVGVLLRGFRLDRCGVSDPSARELVGFVGAKSVTSFCAAVITQADRWVVALVLTPAMVGVYDVAARLASIVRVALNTLLTGLLALSVSISRSERVILYWRSLRLVVAAGAASGLLMFSLGVYGAHLSGIDLNSMTIAIVGTVNVVSLLLTLTSPGVMLATSVGDPWVEVRYILPLMFLNLMAYCAAIATGSISVLLVGLLAGSAPCVFVFASYLVPKSLMRAHH